MRNIMILAMILLAACEREAPQPTDPIDLLPPATQTGENTLGFLLDGEPWTPNRLFQGDYRKSDGAFILACENVTFDDEGKYTGSAFSIIYSDSLWSEGQYQLTELPISRGAYLTNSPPCDHFSSNSSPGKLIITHIDTLNRIISGNFNFSGAGEDGCTDTLSITHGRFDVSF